MLLKHLGIVAIAAILLNLVGCGKGESDKHLIEIAVKVKKQEAKIDRMATTLKSIEHKLDTSPVSGKKSAATSGVAEVEGPASHVVDFRETPEYEKVLAALSAIQQQLALMQTDFAETKEEMKRERWSDPDRQWKALNDPREMTERLDALVENFAQQIDDPIRKQQFEADVEQLRQINSESLSTQELSEWLASIFNERLNNAKDEDTRKSIEDQLSDLASPSEGNLDSAVARVRSDMNRNRLSEMMTAHGIPREVLNDAGLPDPNRPRGSFNLAIETIEGDAIFFRGVAGEEPKKLEAETIRINRKAEVKAQPKPEPSNPKKS